MKCIIKKNYKSYNMKKNIKIELSEGNKKYLKYHRDNVFKNKGIINFWEHIM